MSLKNGEAYQQCHFFFFFFFFYAGRIVGGCPVDAYDVDDQSGYDEQAVASRWSQTVPWEASGKMAKYGEWEVLEPPIGQGGQSSVYLARSPERAAERFRSFQTLRALSGQSLNSQEVAESFSKATWNLARPDSPSELGALKVFKIRDGGAPAEERLKREIAVLRANKPNFPKLLDANEAERWMVTQYFEHGTLRSDLRTCRNGGRYSFNLKIHLNRLHGIKRL